MSPKGIGYPGKKTKTSAVQKSLNRRKPSVKKKGGRK